jgi:O-antigen/teichoic acid export membrane protein
MVFGFIGFSQILLNQGLNVAMGSTLGAQSLVLFVTSRTLANSIKQLTGLFVNTAWPELSRLNAIGDGISLKRVFGVVIRSAMVTTCILSWVLHQYGEKIFSFWLGNSVEFDKGVLDLMLVYVIQSAFWLSCSGFLVATNRVGGLARVSAFNAIVAVLFAVIGAILFGLKGAIVGMIAADFVLPFWWTPYCVNRMLGHNNLVRLAGEFCIPMAILGASIAEPYLAIPGLALSILWWRGCMSHSKKFVVS